VNRRAFLAAAAAGSLIAMPAVARAQQTGMAQRIGYLSPSPGPSDTTEPFREGLRELGYVEGRNIIIEYRWAAGKNDRLPELAAELVRLKKVDVIVAFGVAATQAARNATKTIPIVGAPMGGDPVQSGFVASLARPGGNITGLATFPGRAIHGKNLELLKEAVPGVSRVAILLNPSNPAHQAVMQEVKAAARVLGVQLQPLEARGPHEFDRAFSAMAGERAGALLVMTDGVFAQYVMQLVNFAARHRLPAMYGFADFPKAGGLMSYGPNPSDQFRRAAYFVDKILKGAKPADLPVEQPTKFELVINLKTAKALGLTVPQSLLFRADEVIE
jgi:putative ABC transport system substrate-binding protein